MRAFFFCLILCALGVADSARAQGPFWEQTNGPEGGLITSVAVDSLQRVLAGTAAGGIFMSTDDGSAWFPINNRIGTAHIKFIVTSGKGYDYALTYTSGLFRYQVTDAQYEWVHLDSLKYGGEITAMVVDNDGDIFLAVPKHGIVCSRDNGAHWSESASQLQDSEVYALAVDKRGYVLAVTKFGKLFRTVDHGASWSRLTPSPNGEHALTMCVAFDGSILIAGDNGIIDRSHDDGATWTSSFAEPLGLPWYSLMTLGSNGHIFARNAEGFLFRSEDNGINWHLVDTTITGGDFFPMAGRSNGHLFLGTDFYGLFRSVDDGSTWAGNNTGLRAWQVVAIAANSKGDIFAFTERLAFRTIDRGDHWQLLDVNFGDNFAVNPVLIDHSDNIFVGTELGILRSNDNGTTWKYVDSVAKGNATNLVRAFAVNSLDHVFAATQFGLVVSTDHGDSWAPTSGEPGENYDDAVIVGPHDEVIVSELTGALFRSANEGSTWKQVGTGSGLRAIQADGTLFRISPSLSRSRDTGATWEALYPVAKDSASHIFDILVSKSGDLIASMDTGVFRSTNRGDDWIDVSDGLIEPSLNQILGVSTLVETPDGKFYAASRGQGVFRSIRFLGVRTSGRNGAETPILGQNFPNPFNPTTEIPFTVERSGHITIEVLDVMGRRVAMLRDGNAVPGSYEIGLDGSAWSSGHYFCRITTPDSSSGVWMTLSR